MTDAELRALLMDCLRLWDISAQVVVRDADLAIRTATQEVTVRRADVTLHPVRFLYQTTARADAGRPPRAAPSIVALLSALRIALDGTGGQALRVGGS